MAERTRGSRSRSYEARAWLPVTGRSTASLAVLNHFGSNLIRLDKVFHCYRCQECYRPQTSLGNLTVLRPKSFCRHSQIALSRATTIYFGVKCRLVTTLPS